jgi:glycosyltransferase 2 family protein
MSKRRILISALVAAVLAALVYWQVRSWRKFDWDVFAEQTTAVNWWMIAAAVALIYAADTLRAFRWSIFLRPVKLVHPVRLIAAQFIGFASLALLGRPGELIRPYIIAKKENLGLPSQMAVWTVERIFDFGAVVILLSLDLRFSHSIKQLDQFGAIREAGLFLIGMVVFGIVLALLIRRNGVGLAAWVQRRLRGFPHLGERIAGKILAFSQGLNTIHNIGSLILATLISVVIWSMVAGSYRLVTYAYPDPSLNQLGFSEVILLMFFSIAGGLLQLPVVGGGSQLFTIGALQSLFAVAPELATSCGILLWLVTFVSVTPVGLILARFEHISFIKLAEEEQAELAGSGAAPPAA